MSENRIPFSVFKSEQCIHFSVFRFEECIHFWFSRQELLVLYDENELKIMSTKPLALNEYPTDYFVIHKNRFFKHSGYSEPKIIIEENNKSRFEKNFTDKCYKAIKNALL